MDDAMILPCGHSFGGGGIQHVIKLVCLQQHFYYQIDVVNYYSSERVEYFQCQVCEVPSCSDIEADKWKMCWSLQIGSFRSFLLICRNTFHMHKSFYLFVL